MPGTTYYGEVRAPGAGGRLRLTVPDDATPAEPSNVVGTMEIGSMPRQAMTGFAGEYTGGLNISAKGENRRGRGVDTMFLVVSLSGTLTADRKHISGAIDAVLNGTEQAEWTFVASVQGAKPLEVAETAGGELVALAPEKPGYLDMISTPLKVVAGVVTAGLGALYLWKRR